MGFDKEIERETIKKLNALYGYTNKRKVYDPKKHKEKKQLEIKKHIENCRETNCPIKKVII